MQGVILNAAINMHDQFNGPAESKLMCASHECHHKGWIVRGSCNLISKIRLVKHMRYLANIYDKRLNSSRDSQEMQSWGSRLIYYAMLSNLLKKNVNQNRNKREIKSRGCLLRCLHWWVSLLTKGSNAFGASLRHHLVQMTKLTCYLKISGQPFEYLYFRTLIACDSQFLTMII